MKTERVSTEFRYLLLLGFLFAMLLLPPLLDGNPLLGILSRALMTGILLSAVYSIYGQRRRLITAVVFVVPAVTTLWVSHAIHERAAFYLDNVTTICFLVFVSYHLGHFILTSRQVTANTIYASMCLYMLIGILWAAIFANIHIWYNGAFTLSGDMLPAKVTDVYLEDFVYYSFVTLSTLGYGDMLPVNHTAKSWAVVEAMVGQFYIAVVMARLVSLHVSSVGK